MSQQEKERRSREIVSAIRKEYTLEEEFRIMRQGIARTLSAMGSLLSERQLEQLNQSKEIEDFWKYHDFVEECFADHPDTLEEDHMENAMSDLGVQIIEDLISDDPER